MLNYRDQENAKRQADELVRRYGQNVATEKVDKELAVKPGNLYWLAVRARVVEAVPLGERQGIMAPSARVQGRGRPVVAPAVDTEGVSSGFAAPVKKQAP